MVEGRRVVDRRLGIQWDNKRDMGQAGALSGQRGHMLRYIPKSFPSRTLCVCVAAPLCYISTSRIVHSGHSLNIVLSMLYVLCIVLDSGATKRKTCPLNISKCLSIYQPPTSSVRGLMLRIQLRSDRVMRCFGCFR